MGAFEERVREIIGELCDDELLDQTVEDVLEAHCEVFALYTMSQLMAAQDSASETAKKRVASTFQFYQGKIEAYRELFVKVAFDGLSVEDGTLSDEMYQKAVDFWRPKVEEFIKQTLLIGDTGG